MLQSIFPYDQTVLESFQFHSPREISHSLERATEAFKYWRKLSYTQRGSFFVSAANVLRKNKALYALSITREMGKLLTESRDEIEKCALACDYYAAHAEELLKDEPISLNATESFVTYQPLGAILGVMPWNFPFWQVFRFAIPAMMAGNVALLKHASNVTRCALLIEDVFREANFPAHVFQTLIIDNKTVEGILASTIVQGVALTGSERAGMSVASVAGKNIKRSVLELGGSDPFIVLEDADMELTVKTAVKSRMQNAGQSCIAAKRFIVMKSVKDAFLEKFKSSVEALQLGNPLEDTTTMAPMARLDLAEGLYLQLTQSIQAGAGLVTGGEHHGCSFQPTLLDHVKPGMVSFEEEMFGPVASIITVTSEQDAVDMANATSFGLGASIWTRDIEKGGALARQVEAGSVYVNALMKSDIRMPFGGIKKSGYGRELSFLGIKEFTNAKSIIIA
jgi:succinate-semialdehyde dehydrogenase/glutarate-semialdehyde dehydrogenase